MNSGVDNYLTVIARWIAGLLAVFFIVTALSSLISFNIDRRAFNAGTYSQALESEGFYKPFPTLLGDLLVKNITGNAPGFLQHDGRYT